MRKIKKTPLAAAIGTAVVSAFTATAAHAEANPFGMTELSDGYMQVAEASKGYTVIPATKTAKEASCGEGKCGSMMDGDKMKKDMEGKCGDMMKGKEGKCGAAKKAAEGKCASMMDGDKMKKGMEGSCGDMMKGKEGACGMKKAAEGKCGEGKCGEGKCAANKK